jgi:cobalt-zinc-cadmium efflux system membrane fusion protein
MRAGRRSALKGIVVALAVFGFMHADARAAASAVIAQGRVSFDGTHVVHVGAPLTGRVTRVMVRPGQPVTKGAPLAVITSDLESALADELEAEADAAGAESRYQRQRQVYRVHAETEAEFDAARAARRVAQAALQSARRNVSLLEMSGKPNPPIQTTVRSPVAGRVLSIAVSLGSQVHGRHAGGASQAMFTVGDVRRVNVVAEVSVRDLALLHEGDPITVHELGNPTRRLAGRVARISRAVDPITCTATVWCEIANPDEALRPGVSATVVITTDDTNEGGRASPNRE